MKRNHHSVIVLSTLFLALPWIAACGDADAEESSEVPAVEEFAAPEVDDRSSVSTEPAADSTSSMTLEATLARELDLTVFGRVWDESRLQHELGDREITLLVPNNAAFAGVAEGSVAGEANARAFVLRHALDGAHDRAALAGLEDVERLEGSALAIETSDRGLRVGPADVLRSFTVGTVTVHVLNRPLTLGN